MGKGKLKEPSSQPQILVVEDDIHLARALQAALSRSYRVQTAGAGPTAIERLEQARFDLVMLDLILPQGTGIHVLEHLRSQGETAPPVLVVSALSSQVDLALYADLVVGKLTKPFSLGEMERAVRVALSGRKLEYEVQPGPKASVLLVDDDPHLSGALAAYLKQSGYLARVASSGAEALEVVAKQRFDAVVADWIMPGITGIDLLEQIKAARPEVPVVLMTGYGTPSFLHAAVSAKAADVLTKPFPAQALPIALEKCLRRTENSAPSPLPPVPVHEVKKGKPSGARYTLAHIRGKSAPIERARFELVQAAATDSNVLILGETGTGKELFAHALHELSARAAGPFVVVNAAAIPESLLESELFGYESGAFTGARKEGRPGKVQQANGGTLFLDEIGDLPLALQAKLLRVLQAGEVDVVGGSTRRVNVRLVAATHQGLPEMVQRGAFRGDLFYRLNVVTLRLPPLRERREDVPILAQEYLQELAERYGRPGISFSDEALRILSEYGWPGNVRELRNVVERAFVFCRGLVIVPAHLTPEVSAPPLPHPARTSQGRPADQLDMASQEREAIRRALEACRGNKVQAAKLLGISRAGLYIKLKVYGIK